MTDPFFVKERLLTDVETEALYSQNERAEVFDAMIEAAGRYDMADEDTDKHPNFDVDDFLAYLWNRGWAVVPASRAINPLDAEANDFQTQATLVDMAVSGALAEAERAGFPREAAASGALFATVRYHGRLGVPMTERHMIKVMTPAIANTVKALKETAARAEAKPEGPKIQ